MSTPAERLADVRERIEARGDRPLKRAHLIEWLAATQDVAETGGGQGSSAWADITGKPAVFPPDLVAHLGAADPHTGYQRETEKDANNGYAGLDGSGLVPDARIAATIARDSEVTAAVNAHEADTSVHGIADTTVLATDAEVAAAIATHAGLADPHTGYQRETERGAVNGYASLGADTLVPQDQLGTGTQDGTKFLRDDGTWVAPTASVAVTSTSLSFIDGDTFKRFTIADAACTSTSKIVGTITRATVADANDMGWVYLHTIVSRATGTFHLLVAVLDWNAPAGKSRPNETVTFNYLLSA